MVATAERGAMVFRLPPRAPLIRSVSLRQNSKMKIILLTIFATILIAGMRPRTGALSIGAVRRLATPRQSLFLRGGEDTTAKIQPVFGSSPAPAPAPTGDNEKTAKKVQAKKDLEDENWGIEGKHRAPEIDGVTGEENEEVVWEAQVNVFRMTNGTDWKQRAVGPARMLKHKENGKIRLVVRDSKIMKVRANHFILPGTLIVPHKFCKTAYVYSTLDYAEDCEKPETEIFCFRFLDEEIAEGFLGNFTSAAKKNEEAFNLELEQEAANAEAEGDEVVPTGPEDDYGDDADEDEEDDEEEYEEVPPGDDKEFDDEEQAGDGDEEGPEVPGLKEEGEEGEEVEGDDAGDEGEEGEESKAVEALGEALEGVSVTTGMQDEARE